MAVNISPAVSFISTAGGASGLKIYNFVGALGFGKHPPRIDREHIKMTAV
jgi:diphthamide biosynthesis methyltransferase